MSHRSLGASPSGLSRAAGPRIRRLHFEQLEHRQLLAGHVTVDPSHPLGVISPHLIGTNVIYSRESDALWDDGRVAASLKSLRTGFMRYPGGEVTSFYHWNRNTGVPFKDAWDGHVPVEPHTDWMSFDEYMRQVKLAGATPLVGINIQSGHNHGRVAAGVAEAVALVRYAQSKGYGVEHYFIDNEQYAANANMTATQYANYVNLYASAIRQVDPKVKIVVNWQSFVNNGWKTILDIAGPNIDYVDFHAYWNRDAASFHNWRGQRLMEHGGETYFEKIQNFREEITRQGLDAKVAAFEWNLGPAKWYARPSPFQAALMNSEVFMQFVWAKLDAAAFWPLHFDANAREAEDDRSLLTAGELEQSAVYQMLSMYKELLGKQLVAVKFLGSGVLATAGHQATTNTTTVMLLEKTGRGSDLRISLGNVLKQPGSFQVQAQAFRATGGDLQADRGEIVSIPYVLDRRSGQIRVSVGGYTLTKLTIRHLQPGSQPPQVQPVSPPRLPPPPTSVVQPPVTKDVAPRAADNKQPTPRVPPKPATAVVTPVPNPTAVKPTSTPAQPPSAALLEPEIAPLPAVEDIEPSQGDAEPPPAILPPPEFVPALASEVAAPRSDAADQVFALLATEPGVIEFDAEARSLRAMLASIPDEIVTERKRRPRDFFLASWLIEDELLEV